MTPAPVSHAVWRMRSGPALGSMPRADARALGRGSWALAPAPLLHTHPRDPDPPRLSPVTKQRDALCSDAGLDDRRMPEAPVLRRNAV